MLKVTIVSRGIPAPENPMSGIFEWDQAKALSNAGVEVTFIVLDMRSIRRARKLTTQYYTREGINVVYGSVPLGALPAPMIYTIGKIKLKGLIKQAIERYGSPDIVHAHFTDIGAITASVCRSLKIPCVVTEHSSLMNVDELGNYTKFMGSIAYKYADAVISVSYALQRRIKQHFNRDSVVVNNIVDTDSFSYSPTSRLTGNSIIIVATGSLIHRKGFDLLIEAFRRSRSTNAKLIIIGAGNPLALENRIKASGLTDKVILTGGMSRKEIAESYNAADFFVLASRSETFGVVYIEAMLAGLPVIATRCGGPEEFVDEKCGILIDPENVEQLTDALNKLIATYADYSGEEIHDYAIARFSPEVIARQLVEVYKVMLI